MDLVPGDKEKKLKTPIWEEYKAIVNEAERKEVHGLFLSNSDVKT